MKNCKYLLILALAAIFLLPSCKGRYADNTPNGEIVEVDVKLQDEEQQTVSDENVPQQMSITEEETINSIQQ